LESTLKEESKNKKLWQAGNALPHIQLVGKTPKPSNFRCVKVLSQQVVCCSLCSLMSEAKSAE
jgi:hypothetical protein